MRAKTMLLILSPVVLSWTVPTEAQLTNSGLSSVRARTFDNEDLLVFRPESFDFFGSAVATGDFNGDGVDDLATGIPHHDGIAGSGCTDCGGVVVRYGVSGSGLETGLADDFLSKQYVGSFEPADPNDLFGATLAAGDFNGDGIDDLAVGILQDYRYLVDYGRLVQVGAVQIHYGGASGIQLVGEHFLQPGSNGIPPPFEGVPGNWFGGFFLGGALAAGDFDADGFDDLAIGIPEQVTPCHVARGGGPSEPRMGCYDRTGGVLVMGGGVGGLLPFHGFYMFEGYSGLPDQTEIGDEFGQAVAAADFDGDGFDDLAIGVPGEDGVGAVLIVFGSPFSLLFTDHRFLGEFDLGRPGELGDRFGQTMAAGDFDGDGRADLAIGAPDEDVNATPGLMLDAGAVTVLYGADSGFHLGRTQYFDQGFGNVVDYGSEAGDVFGAALAAGDFNGDGRDDLVVGHHGEDNPGGSEAGAVTILPGSLSVGLQYWEHRNFEPSVAGIPGGAPEDLRYFGYAIAAGDFDGDGFSDLAIGSPLEDVGPLASVGNETILYGSLFSGGFGSGDTYAWLTFAP